MNTRFGCEPWALRGSRGNRSVGHSFLYGVIVSIAACSCSPGQIEPTVPLESVRFPIRGAWLAPRQGVPLDAPQATASLEEMERLGITHVAIGHEVSMPQMSEPRLEFGVGDRELRAVLQSTKRQGLSTLLMPRIESPDFFKPPYPFRADISFKDQADWQTFHAAMGRMLHHYAVLAEAEDVAVLAIGLELKQSVVGYEQAWRAIIADLREVFSGKLTYSANWHDEWERVPFWDALDYVGIGAYFELRPEDGRPGGSPIEDLVARWQPIKQRLRDRAKEWQRPILFTEVGYTGYADCAERPWQWAGKQGQAVPIDLERQAECYQALFATFGSEEWMHGIFVWRFYTESRYVEDWEYGLQGRPAAGVLGRAYRRR